MKRWRAAALLALPILGTMGGYGAWRARRMSPAHAAVPSASAAGVEQTVRAEGRLVTYPGAEVTVSTEAGGTLARVAVEERGIVRKGDTLVEFEASEQKAALAEARARYAEAVADVRFSGTEAARSRKLLATGAITQDALERSAHDGAAAGARAVAAQAAARRLEAALAKTRIAAPIDGTVIARSAQLGETVPPGAHLVTIADLSRVRVEVEVDEFDAGRVVLGAAASITTEGYSGPPWRGHVDEIPEVVAPRRLKPQDPARPTDTRVLLVKVALDEHTPLKIGQRVDVELSTTTNGTPQARAEAHP